MIEFDRFPEEFSSRYESKGYWRGEVLSELLRDIAAEDPNRDAVVEPGRRWTYGELDARADGFAAGLASLGIRRGECAVVQLPNRACFAFVTIGMFRVGVVPVFALPMHRTREITYLCRYSDAVAYLTCDADQGFDFRELAGEVQAAVPALRHIIIDGEAGDYLPLSGVDAPAVEMPRPEPRDVAFFLLSGGTTGLPKLIPRTHNDYRYQLRATAECLGFDAHGAYLASLPIAHNAALGCPGILGSLLVGGKTVLPASPSPDEVFPLIESEQITLTTLMPPLVVLWLETREFFDVDFSRMILQVGSARFAPELARQVRTRMGAKLSQWFDMAEGLLTCTRLDDPDEVVDHTQGRPLCEADEIKVVDGNDVEVTVGEVGELLTRGPYTLRGYYKAAEHNAHAFTPDGYLRTGDLVRIRADGNMVVEGRIKDVINRGGEKIVAGEVEDLMLEHPAVRECAVVPMQDEVMGERVCAFIVAKGEHPQLADVRDFLHERGMADYKFPECLEIVDAMPRTNVGKLDKAALRRDLESRTH